MRCKWVGWSMGLAFWLTMGLGCSGDGSQSAGQSQAPAAPNFTLAGIDGGKVSLADYRGKVVILDFWATWCGPCKKEIPHFVELYQTYKKAGLEIIGITMDSGSAEEVQAFARDYNMNYTLVMGNRQVTRDFGGIRGYPTTFVIDQQGRIQKRYLGYRSKEVFETDIKNLLGHSAS